MEKSLHLTLLSPEKRLFDGQVAAVTLPGEKGRFTVLPMHASLITTLEAGTIAYKSTGESEASGELRITSGFAEVKNNQVTACVEL